MTYFQREDFEAAWGTAKKVVAKVTLKNGKKYSDVMEVPSEIPGLDLVRNPAQLNWSICSFFIPRCSPFR